MRYLKNIVVQERFNINCNKNIVNEEQYGKHFLFFHTNKKDNVIIPYKIGHTTPNT